MRYNGHFSKWPIFLRPGKIASLNGRNDINLDNVKVLRFNFT